MQLFHTLLCLLLLALARSEEEVKWTANPNDDGGGPLPLSTKQREQLTQLEQAIMSSPDPQATLQQVAANNNMSPQDLAGMLQRNRADMGQSPQGISPLSTNPIVKLAGLVTNLMKQHPKVSAAVVSFIIFVLYLRMIEMPRSGIAISTSSRSILSRGPTTILSPPTAFVDKLLDRIETDLKIDDGLFELLEIPEDVAFKTVQKIPQRSKEWKRAFVAQERISLKGTDEENVEEILLDQAARLLSDPSSLVEWIPNVRLAVDENKAILVYPGVGDYGRYALIPFLITEQSDQQLVLSTTKGSYFDGQIIIEIEDRTVRVSMIVVRGRAPPKSFLHDMARSVAKSLQAHTRQVLARRSQSERYRASSEAYLARRRAQRDAKARAIEEMAADRRRRWQRNNPNSGHYRPSGDRMRSPNNAVY